MPKTEKEVVAKTETVKESAEKKAFRELIEAYAKQNPVKYEAKKESLSKQLSQIK